MEFMKHFKGLKFTNKLTELYKEIHCMTRNISER